MYDKPDEKSHIWLQGNIELKKLASIIAVQEHGGNKGIEGKHRLTSKT